MRCPRCNHRFHFTAAGSSLVAAPSSSATIKVSQPSVAAEASTEPTPPRSVSLGAGLLVGGLLVIVSLAAWFVPKLFRDEGSTIAAEGTAILAAAKSEPLPPALELVKFDPAEGSAKPLKETPEQAKINRAIERGAKYLEREGRSGRIGAQALAGLTLLHCGSTTDDQAVRAIARHVRDEARKYMPTYELATAIMFLDRLGDPADGDLIRDMGVQLIGGQGMMGGWTYGGPAISAAERKALQETLEARESSEATRAPVPGELKKFAVLRHRAGAKIEFRKHQEDNSNTQFAVLALWAAQKHGAPAAASLAFAEDRFRSSQHPKGTWSYTWTAEPTMQSLDSMTCAGLLGLAVGLGNQTESRAKLKEGDAAMEKAFAYLGRRLNNKLASPPAGRIVAANAHGDLYCLWSLERVAVIYGLQTIGGVDWYAWGAPRIVAAQHQDGSWHDAHAGVPDTCFALLFLRRANIAQDLTARLKNLAIPKHVGERGSLDLTRSFSPNDDPFGRTPRTQPPEERAAGYARGRE